jgi:hypothetical protein
MTHEELVERISKILLEMDGKDLADLYNREFGEGLTYIGDSLFEQGNHEQL